ncbi:MAG: pectin acetylesterase-family hydrolase [Rubrivivax sp.]
MRSTPLAFGLAAALLAGPALAADFWRRIDNPAPVTGLDGKPHAATCSGYPGTNAEFTFWARRGKVDKLVVYFEGGGACWDDLTCTFPADPRRPDTVPQFYNPSIRAGSAPRNVPGLFDETNPDNPTKDWSFVYIPYCTGDVHVGSADRTYNNAGWPTLPASFQIHHRGFDNFMVVLDWISKNVKAPQQVLVTGVSAGGYGAAANAPWVAKLFPSAQFSVLADASQGVTTPNWYASTPGYGSWNAQLAPWVFGPPGTTAPGDFVRAGARAYPGGRFAQYTTNTDATQIGFYSVMTQFYGPGGSCADPAADWNQQMLATLGSYTGELANFRSYVAPGTTHTILRSADFYTTPAWGPSVAGWLTNQLGGAPAWANAACPDCLAPLPCP